MLLKEEFGLISNELWPSCTCTAFKNTFIELKKTPTNFYLVYT